MQLECSLSCAEEDFFKDLNFIPTPEVCNKHKLNEELESLYRLLKLKAHFEDNGRSKLTAEEQIFKPHQ